MGMPAREKYGAQPPLELIRTLMGAGSLYDLKDTSLKKVVGTVVVAAMGLPAGGRTLPSNRLLRHFSLISLPELSGEMLLHVFSQILSSGMSRNDPIWARQAAGMAALSVALF